MCTELPRVVISLQGRFKGESGVGRHVLYLASTSSSGLKTRWWMEKLVKVCELEGQFCGPAITSPDGRLTVSADYNAMLVGYLTKIQQITELINKEEIISVLYSLSRTPRRSAQTRAARASLAKDLQEDMNRWRTIENSKGRRPRFNMRQLYSEVCLLMSTTWLYSYAL